MSALSEKPVSASSGEGKPWWQEAVSMFTRLSGWVILPFIVAFFLGRWLDERAGGGQKWFFISLAGSFIISTIGMAWQAKQEYAKIAALSPEPDTKKDSDNDRS